MEIHISITQIAVYVSGKFSVIQICVVNGNSGIYVAVYAMGNIMEGCIIDYRHYCVQMVVQVSGCACVIQLLI
jgi:hypothetical protein